MRSSREHVVFRFDSHVVAMAGLAVFFDGAGGLVLVLVVMDWLHDPGEMGNLAY
jgi:hypothetical protein